MSSIESAGSSRQGVALALGAYGIWGLFPLYWKLLQGTGALELIAHRVVWSALLVFLILAVQRRPSLPGVRSLRTLGFGLLAGLLVGTNWLLYVWAVNAGRIVETSLGYYINPLFSVLLGTIVLKERLRHLQWVATGLAALAVLWLTLGFGEFPWIALGLAGSFGLYGLAKKQTQLDPVQGLGVETFSLFLPALGFLIWLGVTGQGSFLNHAVSGMSGPATSAAAWAVGPSATRDLLLAGAGIVTTVPLLLFAGASQKLPLWLMGVFQYLTPTSQLLLGLLVFHEDFGPRQILAFGLVWIALALFALESFIHTLRASMPAPTRQEA